MLLWIHLPVCVAQCRYIADLRRMRSVGGLSSSPSNFRVWTWTQSIDAITVRNSIGAHSQVT